MSTPSNPPEGGGTDTFVMVGGQDWDQVVTAAAQADAGERIVVNMGPQHPSTHGVLRLILEIEGETIIVARCGIGYLHTGIEKNLEYRNWTQGVTFVTRMDYLSPFFNETAYCLGVEKLLGVTDDIPERASVIRVMLMELNRISSHLVALATGGMELGSMAAMFFGFREREQILSIFETITGLRMNHAYIRPGGLAADLPDEALPQIRDMLTLMPKRLQDSRDLLSENYIWKARTQGIGYLDLTGCMALGITGPVLRSTGLPHDLRRVATLLRLRDLRLRRHHRRRLRRLRPLPDPGQGDARVAEDRRAVRRTPGEDTGPGDDRRQEAGMARRPETRARTGWAIPPSTSPRSWATRWRG